MQLGEERVYFTSKMAVHSREKSRQELRELVLSNTIWFFHMPVWFKCRNTKFKMHSYHGRIHMGYKMNLFTLFSFKGLGGGGNLIRNAKSRCFLSILPRCFSIFLKSVCVHRWVCNIHVGAFRGYKKALGPLKLEWSVVLSSLRRSWWLNRGPLGEQ